MSIPNELQGLRSWVIWGVPGAKDRKQPYWADGAKREGKQGNPDDTARLVTNSEARTARAVLKAEGVGLAMLPENGLVALDFDGCVENGVVNPVVQELVEGTYAEISPSGNGVRALFRGELVDAKDSVQGKSKDGTTFGFEVFHRKGYVTITGKQLPGSPDTIAELPQLVRDYAAKRFGPKTAERHATEVSAAGPKTRVGYTVDQVRELLKAADPDQDNDDWSKVCRAVLHELGHTERALALLVDWSASGRNHTDRNHCESELRKYWQSAAWSGDAPDAVTIHYVESLPAKLESFPVEEADVNKPGAVKRKRFTPTHVGDFMNGPEPEWIIEGLIPRAELMMIYGAPGCGKSFFAADIAATIARGVPWRDRATTRGRCVYVCGEGAHGFRTRWRAYEAAHSIKLADFDLYMLDDMPNLLTADDVRALIPELQALGPLDLVIIDTLARAAPGGNESGPEDMGVVLQHCKLIHEVTGALVCLIHHSGKDEAKGARGWSGILGAVDAEIEVSRTNDKAIRQARVTKMRDGEDGSVFDFRLDPQLVFTASGKTVESLIVMPTERAAALKLTFKRPNGSVQGLIWDVLDAAMHPLQSDELITEAAGRLAHDPAKQDRRRDTVINAINRLCADGTLKKSAAGLYMLARDTEYTSEYDSSPSFRKWERRPSEFPIDDCADLLGDST
jgi:AAA domain/Primase C terminal 2 (PriCT-2)